MGEANSDAKINLSLEIALNRGQDSAVS